MGASRSGWESPCQLLRKKAAKKAYWQDDTKNGENIKGILLTEAGGNWVWKAILIWL
jgi:hypothetical protein